MCQKGSHFWAKSSGLTILKCGAVTKAILVQGFISIETPKWWRSIFLGRGDNYMGSLVFLFRHVEQFWMAQQLSYQYTVVIEEIFFMFWQRDTWHNSFLNARHVAWVQCSKTAITCNAMRSKIGVLSKENGLLPFFYPVVWGGLRARACCHYSRASSHMDNISLYYMTYFLYIYMKGFSYLYN